MGRFLHALQELRKVHVCVETKFAGGRVSSRSREEGWRGRKTGDPRFKFFEGVAPILAKTSDN